MQSLEAIRTLEEKIVDRPIDGDLASVLGWGYPAHLGGVFSYVDRIGAAEFARRAKEYAARFGGLDVAAGCFEEFENGAVFP